MCNNPHCEEVIETGRNYISLLEERERILKERLLYIDENLEANIVTFTLMAMKERNRFLKAKMIGAREGYQLLRTSIEPLISELR